MLQKMIEQLCEELKISPTPKADKEGAFSFRWQENVVTFLRPLNPGVAFSGQITPCPLKRREELFLYLMRANLLGQGTGQGRIGLEAQEKILTLSLGLPYELHYKEFRERLEDFVNYLIYWRECVAKFENEHRQL